MTESNYSDPVEYVSRCRYLKAQALEDRSAAERPPAVSSSSEQQSTTYSLPPFEQNRVPNPRPIQRTEAYRSEQQQQPVHLSSSAPHQFRPQITSGSDSSLSRNTVSSLHSSDRSVASSRTASSGYSTNSSGIYNMDDLTSTGSSVASQVGSRSYQNSGTSSNTSQFESRSDVGSSNISDASSGFQSGTGSSTSGATGIAPNTSMSSTPADRLCKVCHIYLMQ